MAVAYGCVASCMAAPTTMDAANERCVRPQLSGSPHTTSATLATHARTRAHFSHYGDSATQSLARVHETTSTSMGGVAISATTEPPLQPKAWRGCTRRSAGAASLHTYTGHTGIRGLAAHVQSPRHRVSKAPSLTPIAFRVHEGPATYARTRCAERPTGAP